MSIVIHLNPPEMTECISNLTVSSLAVLAERDVVRDVEEVSACGAAYEKLDNAVVISFLFNYWVVINGFVIFHRSCGTRECGMGKIVPVRISLIISSASARSHANLSGPRLALE
jgi:hypothetical protein